MKKHDGVNFSPITEEMSKQHSARTNYLMNNSSLVHESEYDPNNIEYSHVSQFQLTTKEKQNFVNADNGDPTEKAINEDIRNATYAEQQSPLENKFKESLSQVLEGEVTDVDLESINMRKQPTKKDIKTKSKSTSPSPQKHSIQQSYQQPLVGNLAHKNKKKKKHRMFIQEQPFKMDGNSKSNSYQQYNALEDRFLKGFFNNNRIKNLKKQDKPKHQQKKSDKLNEHNSKDNNAHQSVSPHTQPPHPHFIKDLSLNQQYLEYQHSIYDPDFAKIIPIEQRQLTEISDHSKELSSQNSQAQSGSATSLKKQWNEYISVANSVDTTAHKLQEKQDKENVFGSKNQIPTTGNQRYSLNSQNSIKMRKLEQQTTTTNYINKSTDFQTLKIKDTNQINPLLSNKPHLQPIQYFKAQSPLGSHQGSTKYSNLPRISTAASNQMNGTTQLFRAQQGQHDHKSSSKDNFAIQSLDFEVNIANKTHFLSNKMRPRIHTVNQSKRNISPYSSNNNFNHNNNTEPSALISQKQNSQSKPFCTLNGIQIPIPKSLKTEAQNIQFPPFSRQIQQKQPSGKKHLLNQSLNFSSPKHARVDLSFQEQDKNAYNYRDSIYSKFQYIENDSSNQINSASSSSEDKLNNTLSKMEFSNFLESLKKKYTPSNREDSSQFQNQLYESKLLKEYKVSIHNQDSL